MQASLAAWHARNRAFLHTMHGIDITCTACLQSGFPAHHARNQGFVHSMPGIPKIEARNLTKSHIATWRCWRCYFFGTATFPSPWCNCSCALAKSHIANVANIASVFGPTIFPSQFFEKRPIALPNRRPVLKLNTQKPKF
jgi:hypothetical protein